MPRIDWSESADSLNLVERVIMIEELIQLSNHLTQNEKNRLIADLDMRYARGELGEVWDLDEELLKPQP